MEPENVILELNDILAMAVELVLLSCCPNDDDCDKNKIETKHFSEGLSSHVAVWSSAKRNRVPWIFCIFNFLEKKSLIKSILCLKKNESIKVVHIS